MSAETLQDSPTHLSEPRRRWRNRPHKSVGGGQVIAVADQGIVSAVNFLTTVLVGRSGGPGQLGVYSLGFSILLLVLSVLDALVTGPYIIRLHQLRTRLAQYTGSTILHTGCLGAIATAAMLIAGYVWARLSPTNTLPGVLLPTAAIVTPVLFRELARRLAFVDGRPVIALALDSGVALMQSVGLIIAAHLGALTSTMALTASGLACACCSWIFFAGRLKKLEFIPGDALQDFVDNARIGKWLLASQCAMTAQFTSVQWLAAIALGTAQTGELSACMSVVMVVNPFLTGIGNLLLPRASFVFASEGPRALSRVLNIATATILAGTTVFVACMAAFGPRVLGLMYGSRYTQSHQILLILAFGIALRGTGMAAYLGLWVTGRARTNFLTNLLGLGTTIAVSLLGVGEFGLAAVAYGMLAGEACAATARWIVLKKSLSAHPQRLGALSFGSA